MGSYTIKQLISKTYATIEFSGSFEESFGRPEKSGSWLIWGASGNGKTAFAVQLAKELTKFDNVLYCSMEEGARKSMSDQLITYNLDEVNDKLKIVDDNIKDLEKRLKKKGSEKIVFIDSVQYSQINKNDYIEFKNKFKNKLLIFISHAEGKNPEGRTAKFIRYDADLKIRVEGLKAFPVSRFGGGKPFVIWNQGAEVYWGPEDNNQNKELINNK